MCWGRPEDRPSVKNETIIGQWYTKALKDCLMRGLNHLVTTLLIQDTCCPLQVCISASLQSSICVCLFIFVFWSCCVACKTVSGSGLKPRPWQWNADSSPPGTQGTWINMLFLCVLSHLLCYIHKNKFATCLYSFCLLETFLLSNRGKSQENFACSPWWPSG